MIVSEIPYGVNRAELVKRIAALVNEKIIGGISDVRDESDENTRVVIDLKRDANPKVLQNMLYKHTALESSFSVAMLAIDRGKPRLLSLKDALTAYIEHRREVILRRTRYLLKQAEERAERLEALLIALANLDDFIKIIRDSKDRDHAKGRLLDLSWTQKAVEQIGILISDPAKIVDGKYRFTERQVVAILELRLYQLTGLERDSIKSEYDELLATIKDLLDILAKESRVLAIIKAELSEIKEKYAGPRLTQIVPDEGDINMEDLIANEGCIITITHKGFIKRTALSAYRAQRRGGKGVIGMATRESQVEGEEGDFVEHLFTASTHDYLMFFTKGGRVYVEKVYEIPEMGRASKGRSIANLLNLQSGETIAATLRIQAQITGIGAAAVDKTWSDENSVFFATRAGVVKKTTLSKFANIRSGGIIAIKIEDGNELIDVRLTDGESEVVLVTKNGISIRFSEADLRDQGRDTVGVRGIRLGAKDEVIGAAIVVSDAGLLVAGENGVGKRTPFDEYRLQSRGGKGIITMKTGDKTGKVVGALTVADKDEIMLITSAGQMVRNRVAEIREVGRNTMGVRLMNFAAKEKLQAIAPVVSTAAEDEVSGDTPEML
ncbi:MAG: DNA gyrase C-terminal beta-propeller domain-containing protein, partial [Chthoniobacterales bacterium]